MLELNNNFSYNWIFFQKIRLEKGCQFDVFDLRKTLKIDFWLLKKKLNFVIFLIFWEFGGLCEVFTNLKKKINQSKIQFHYLCNFAENKFKRPAQTLKKTALWYLRQWKSTAWRPNLCGPRKIVLKWTTSTTTTVTILMTWTMTPKVFWRLFSTK